MIPYVPSELLFGHEVICARNRSCSPNGSFIFLYLVVTFCANLGMAQGGAGFAFVCEPGPQGSPLFEQFGAILAVKKLVLK